MLNPLSPTVGEGYGRECNWYSAPINNYRKALIARMPLLQENSSCSRE